MANFYVNRINNELMKVEEVPKLWRTKVIEAMRQK